MNKWDEAFVEYVETGKVSFCPNCGKNSIATEGFISGRHGSLTMRCTECNEQRHYDGFASMHDNAQAESIVRFA